MFQFNQNQKIALVITFTICSLLLIVVPTKYRIIQNYKVDGNLSEPSKIQDVIERIPKYHSIKTLRCKLSSNNQLIICKNDIKNFFEKNRALRRLKQPVSPPIGWIPKEQIENIIYSNNQDLSSLEKKNAQLKSQIQILKPELDKTALEFQEVEKTIVSIESEITKKESQQKLIEESAGVERDPETKNTFLDKIKSLKVELKKLKNDLVVKKTKLELSDFPQIKEQKLKNQIEINEIKKDEIIIEKKRYQKLLTEYSSQSLIPDPDDVQIKPESKTKVLVKRNLFQVLWAFPLTFLFFGALLKIPALRKYIGNPTSHHQPIENSPTQTIAKKIQSDLELNFLGYLVVPTKNDKEDIENSDEDQDPSIS